MGSNPRLPAPAYGYGRKRTESRRIEGPGSSEYILTHRHGSGYQKQSVFAGAEPQSSSSLYNGHGRRRTYRYSAPQHGHHGHQPELDKLLLVRRKDKELTISSSSEVSSEDIADMHQRSPRGLTFGISLASSNSDKTSSVSFTQTCQTGLDHGRVKGSKNTIESGLKESIFRVSSSRYTHPLDMRLPVEAELVLQPPPRPTEKSLSPLLTWR